MRNGRMRFVNKTGKSNGLVVCITKLFNLI